MTIYTYLNSEDAASNKAAQEGIEAYVQNKKLSIDNIISEEPANRANWHKRKIAALLDKQIKAGDTIIVNEAADLAPSTIQMLEILTLANNAGINIHFAKYNVAFEAKTLNRTVDLIHLLRHIDNDFISRRTTEALARRRAAGLPLGRPKGRQNKSLKLDKFKKDIVKYLDLAVSKTSIAKLVGCHPQTLYDWIDRHEVADKKARKPRKANATAKAATANVVATKKQTATA